MKIKYYLTQTEADLIATLRNIRKVQPDNRSQLELFAQMLFEQLLDRSEDEDEE